MEIPARGNNILPRKGDLKIEFFPVRGNGFLGESILLRKEKGKAVLPSEKGLNAHTAVYGKRLPRNVFGFCQKQNGIGNLLRRAHFAKGNPL